MSRYGIISVFVWSFRMGSLEDRIAAYADTTANLIAQLTELTELREQVRKAQLSARDHGEPKKQRPVSANRRAPRRVLGYSAA
jgi:hypothetical protein